MADMMTRSDAMLIEQCIYGMFEEVAVQRLIRKGFAKVENGLLVVDQDAADQAAIILRHNAAPASHSREESNN